MKKKLRESTLGTASPTFAPKVGTPRKRKTEDGEDATPKSKKPKATTPKKADDEKADGDKSKSPKQ
jgi:hypothetical protein